ncbi:hypothetical protein R75483_00651 [Paraburkholderia domus]|nr:hypothetical protein R75483_00651 [Paraburkholderia domus]
MPAVPPARRGQVARPPHKGVDGCYAVRDLPTAPRPRLRPDAPRSGLPACYITLPHQHLSDPTMKLQTRQRGIRMSRVRFYISFVVIAGGACGQQPAGWQGGATRRVVPACQRESAQRSGWHLAIARLPTNPRAFCICFQEWKIKPVSSARAEQPRAGVGRVARGKQPFGLHLCLHL